MKKTRTDLLSLSLAAALAVGAAVAAVAAAAAASTPIPVTGREQGFDGCLAREPDGIHYFDLTGAKLSGGTTIGDLRLNGSLTGIRPKELVGQKVHVNGYYRAADAKEPDGFAGRVVVSDAKAIGGACS